jgi:GDP-mannose 6-dehydrogenase
MLYRARHADADLPALGALLRSNEMHIQRALDAIVASGRRRIGVIGLSFKSNTDDLRESPMVTLVEHLIGRGFDLRVFDRDVMVSQVFGRNREYIDRTVPHIASLVCETLDELVTGSELIVVGKKFSDLESVLAQHPTEDQQLLDLARVWPARLGDVAGRRVSRIC